MAAQQNTTSISVVVCAHTEKRWTLLCETIDSLARQTHPAHEIILVIDHNPNMLTRCQTHFGSTPGVQVVPNVGNGLPDARNTGVEHATGDVIAFIDDDAIAESDWLAQHAAAYDNPNESCIMGVGGRIMPRWESHRPAWFPEEFNWTVGCTYVGIPLVRTRIRNPIGCNMSFTRRAFENGRRFKMGRKEGTVKQNHDETEFSIRLRQEIPDCQIVFEPSARVHHFVPNSRLTAAFFFDRTFNEGRSKAKLSSMVGADDSLSTERSYTFKTLPLGVLRGLGDVFRLRFAGLARACMITLGLASTTSGYMIGLLDR
jgi:glycosyltransferase involved in cell wall biosynthesis